MTRKALRPLLSLLALLASAECRAVFLACSVSDGTAVPCRIWLVPLDPTSALIPIHAGEQSPTPAGRYLLRAESPQGVLAAPASVVVTEPSDEPKSTPDRLVLRPGARLEFPPALLEDGGTAHVLSLETGAIETVFMSQRRFSVVPAGRAIVLGLRGPNRIAGVTRPFAIPKGGVVDAPSFDTPTDASGHVVLSWQFPTGLADGSDDLSPHLEGPGASLRPDFSYSDRGQLHWAVFYDVPAGSWQATMESRSWHCVPLQVSIEPGKVAFPDPVALTANASLALMLGRPDSLRELPYSVRLFRVTDSACEPARIGAHLLPELDPESVDLVAERSAATGVVRVDRLKPGCYAAAFECGGHHAHGLSALRDTDAELSATLSPIEISGSLAWSGRAGPGALRFTHLNDGTVEATVDAGEDGAYRAIVWQPGTYSIRIRPSDDGAGVTKILRVPAGREFQTADFDLPAGVFRYRVVDESAGSPVIGARLCCLPGADDESSTVRSDAEGRLRFRLAQPASSGAVETSIDLSLRITAEGYEPEDVRLGSTKPNEPESLVRLRKRDDETEINVLLPDGTPARGALVFLAPLDAPPDDLARTRTIRCDEDGIARLSKSLPDGQPAAFVHPAGAIAVSNAGDLRRSGSITLPAAAGRLDLRLSRGPLTSTRQISLVLLLNGVAVPVAAAEMSNLLAGSTGFVGAQRDPGGEATIALRASLLPAGPAKVYVLARAPGLGEPSRVVLAPRDVWIPHESDVIATLP